MRHTLLPLITPLAAIVLMSVGCGDNTTSASSDPDRSVTTDASSETTPETTSPGADEPLGGGSYPIGELTVSWGHPLAEEQNYTISCLGDTATLTGDWDQSSDTIGDIAADKMCSRLAEDEVQNRLINGEPADQLCTQIFGSDHEAVVTGTIDGNEINTSFHRSNGCGIDDWDALMKDVLPDVG